MDGVINSLLLFPHLAEDKKKKVAQIQRSHDPLLLNGWRDCPPTTALFHFCSANGSSRLRKTPRSLHVFAQGGDKWGKEPIGAANGMTAAALLPASEAGGVLRRGQTADAPN